MARTICRWLLGLAYLVAAWFHIVAPEPFLAIMPGWVPWPEEVVFWTGIAEAAGAFALLQGQGRVLRKAAGWGLAAYALCVWPANWNHLLLDLAREDGGLGLWYHVPRLAAQPVLIWAALWVSGAARRRKGYGVKARVIVICNFIAIYIVISSRQSLLAPELG